MFFLNIHEKIYVEFCRKPFELLFPGCFPMSFFDRRQFALTGSTPGGTTRSASGRLSRTNRNAFMMAQIGLNSTNDAQSIFLILS